MESFFSTVKNELADQFASHGDAKLELFDYIEVFYNQRRRHSTIGRISPAAFERGSSSITKPSTGSAQNQAQKRVTVSKRRSFLMRALQETGTLKGLAGDEPGSTVFLGHISVSQCPETRNGL